MSPAALITALSPANITEGLTVTHIFKVDTFLVHLKYVLSVCCIVHNAFLVTRFFRWVWLYIQTANHLYTILQQSNPGSLFLDSNRKLKRMSTTQVELTWKAPHPPSLAPDLWRENEVLLSPKSTCGPNRLKFHSVSSLRTFFSKYALKSFFVCIAKILETLTGQGFFFLNNDEVFPEHSTNMAVSLTTF